eukprot:4861766-Prymnesium_polylepis.1
MATGSGKVEDSSEDNIVLQNWLDKKSGGKEKTISIGNLQDKWDRRWFVLTSDGTLRYYRKQEDFAAGVAPAGTLSCRGGAIGRHDDDSDDAVFTISTRGRVLTARAASDDDVTSWIVALAPIVALKPSAPPRSV